MTAAARPGTAGGLWAVLPVKPFGRAKTRLAPVLTPEERAALAEAMFRDVLETVAAAGLFAGLLVMTDDARAAALARAAGAEARPDPVANAETNAAVMAALNLLPPGAAAMIVQADLPLLRAADLHEVAAAHAAGSGVTAVPARDGGTTILALSAARPIRPAFGRHSHTLHLARARAAGLMPAVPRPVTALCDLDRPGDLALLRASPVGSRCAGLASLADAVLWRPPTQESDPRNDRFDAGYVSVR